MLTAILPAALLAMASLPAADTLAEAATVAHLSSAQIESLLGSSANLPPECEATYRNGRRLGVAGREDDPTTPWYDPVPVLYECSEFGL